MISEQFMQLGRWDLRLSPDTPLSVRHLIKPGDQIIVTPSRLPMSDLPAVGMGTDTGSNVDAIANTIIESARFRGPILEVGDGNTSLGGHGLLWYLGNSSGDGPFINTNSAASRTWVQHLTFIDTPPTAPATISDGWNGLTKGSVVSAPSGTWPPTGTDPDDIPYTALDRLIELGEILGAEFYVRPDGTFKHGGTGSALFTTTPTVILQRGREGRDVDLIGLRLTGMNRTHDIWTTVHDGFAAIPGPSGFMDHNGPSSMLAANGSGTWYVNYVEYENLSAASSAAATAALKAKPEQDRLEVSVDAYDPGRWMMPGDWLWAYDPISGVYDSTEATTYQGQHVTPAKLRLFGMDWPVRQGMGVYRLERKWGPSTESVNLPLCIDLTDYVEFEDGPVRLDVGGRGRSYDQ